MTDVGVALIAGTVFGFLFGGLTVFVMLAAHILRDEGKEK